jgi:N-acetylmuramoyl-L-alanine amidase
MPPGLARDRVLCVRSAGCSLTARTGYNPLRMLPAAVAPPPVVQHPIPFGARRRADMAAYARRHYGLCTWRLRSPRVIVEHLTVNGSLRATYAAFAPNVPDPELHERPGTCSHFAVGRDGTTWQLVPLGTMCRHTVGLNWTAIGVEHVGFRDGDVLGDRRQLRASLRLTRWLRCRFGIGVRDVIGHSESLRSPYHRERVARLRRQTHGDWSATSMRAYRGRLRALGACPA